MTASRIVAIVELAGSAESAAAALAPDLGTTAYDLRLVLGAGLPAVVLATSDEAHAARVRLAIQKRGHRVVECDLRDVVASSAMTALRDFRLEPGEIVAGGDGSDRLPLSDVVALFRATHRESHVSTHQVKERKLRPGMALATGGLIMTKTTTREVTEKTEEREQVLYLFRASGGTPWILREKGARYMGLGVDIGRTAVENFGKTVQKLRALAPGSTYDERLVASRSIRSVGLADGVEATDLLAHLLAAALRRATGLT